MDRKPVSSSNIKAIGYNEEENLLEIEFQTGAVYQYQGVNILLFNELMSASSIGSFFAKTIKYQFATNKIE